MTDPRIDVILEHINMVCKFFESDHCGRWCSRAFNESGEGRKFVNCEGQLKNCELKEGDRINETGKFE